MGTITRTVHVAHNNGSLLGGLFHYVNAASNHAAREYRKGARGKELYHMAVHHTGIYRDMIRNKKTTLKEAGFSRSGYNCGSCLRSRFADYVIQDVRGSHRAWRTNRLADSHARAPHYHPVSHRHGACHGVYGPYRPGARGHAPNHVAHAA